MAHAASVSQERNDENTMAEEKKHATASTPTIMQPHGREQQIKMEILDMIHSGENPFDIIYHMAKWLEKAPESPVMRSTWKIRSAPSTGLHSNM